MIADKKYSAIDKNTSIGKGVDNKQSADIENVIDKVEQLIGIGIALSAEKDVAILLENILLGAKSITHADGGTLYTVEGDSMKIAIIQSDSLGLALRGSHDINMSNIPLYDENGDPNLKNVVSYSYHSNKAINIEDAYDTNIFDFSGTKFFDQKNNYRSTSFLSIPLTNHLGEIIGILQLINAIDTETQKIIAFDSVSQRFAEALASHAAAVLTKQQLITELENMFDSLIKLLAIAVDKKSPHTGGHCRRVPELTSMLAEAAHSINHGYLKDFTLNDADRYELSIAGWLHDCGKIVTPVHVIDKSTKLETIFDRIHLLETRFEVFKRDLEIAHLKRKLTQPHITPLSLAELESNFQDSMSQLDDDFTFIHRCNVGGETMSDDDLRRLKSLQQQTWTLNNVDMPLISEEELYNLSILRGTLTMEERKIINNHIDVTITMLEAIHFPKHLKNVVEYAGGHHERMDGKGYPKGLHREQMSIQARAMAIADIFEALTAIDRPYKAGKTLSEALSILKKMKEDGHIDPDLYDAFINKKVYKAYAEKFLDDFQIDID
jgi:HD-GYP domain-containing protein (c-di-GMP phosphodiesterase class II)